MMLCTPGFVDDVMFADNRPGRGDTSHTIMIWGRQLKVRRQHGFDTVAYVKLTRQEAAPNRTRSLMSTITLHSPRSGSKPFREILSVQK